METRAGGGSNQGGILFFALLYLETLQFALIYFNPSFLPLFTLPIYNLPFLISFFSLEDLGKIPRQHCLCCIRD
jgi:hypothetical protein